MTKSFIIFRKDVRHLWPHIAAFLALMAFAAILDPTYSNRGQSSTAYSLILGFALPLACWNLIIGAIQEEKLIGDRQYWLTRPFSWRQLLGAKAIFVVVLINLPLFLWHAGAYVAVGIPVWQQLPALLWRQLFFSAFYILPAAALASITRGLGQIILTTLLIVLPALFLETFVFARYRLAWLNIEGRLITAIAVLMIAGVTSILILQYSRRNTTLSRMVAASILAAVLALAITAAKISGGTAPPTTVSNIRISLDASSGRQSRVLPSGDGTVTLDIPILVEGVHPGVELVESDIRISIEGNHHMVSFDNRMDGGFHDLSGGTAWITLYVGRIPFGWVKSAPARLRGSVSFRAFGDKQLFPLPKGHPVVVPKVGVCTEGRDESGLISLICYTPDPRASVVIGTTRSRLNWIIPQGLVNRSIPTSSDMQPLTKFSSLLSYHSWDELGGRQLMTAEPLPSLQVNFDLPAVDLQRYVVN